MSRYKKLDALTISESKEVFFFDLFINPFQVESFYETDVEFTNESGKREMHPCCYITTKSGSSHNVLGTSEEIIKQLEC